jgi:hypothetical protein
MRRAIAVMAPVNADNITQQPASAAINDAIRLTGASLAKLNEIRRQLDSLAAARETLPLRGPGALEARADASGARFLDVQTPPATDDTPPLCGCGARDACTHRRY